MTLILTSHRVLVKLMITRNYTTLMPSPYHDKRNSYCQFKSQKNTPGFWCILREKLHAKQRQKQTNLVVSCQVVSQYITPRPQDPTSIHDIQHPSKRYSDHGDYPLELAAQPFTSTPQPLSQHLPNI
jgi:hypothetical protein